jgi:hypothetical protein
MFFLCCTRMCLLDGTSWRHFGSLDDNGSVAMAVEVWESEGRHEVAVVLSSVVSRGRKVKRRM